MPQTKIAELRRMVDGMTPGAALEKLESRSVAKP